jgi:hypothetical protein
MSQTCALTRAVDTAGARTLQPVFPAGSCPLRSESDLHGVAAKCREWDGPAVLSPRTAQRMTGGLEARGAHRYVP